MTLKRQIRTIKENWIILAALIILLLLLNAGSMTFTKQLTGATAPEMAADAGMPQRDIVREEGFAPDTEQRLITKSSYLDMKVSPGEFESADMDVREVISDLDAYLLNENIQARESGWSEWRTGRYTIKIRTDSYDEAVERLKDIGEVQSFSEDADDITERHEDLSIQLETERQRLQRYQELYESADSAGEKLEITDRIFEQERRVRYLEEALTNVEERVSYSTIRMPVREESPYAGVSLVTFSDLAKELVRSLNNLLQWLVLLLPWTIAAWIVWLIWRRRK